MGKTSFIQSTLSYQENKGISFRMKSECVLAHFIDLAIRISIRTCFVC